MNVFDRAYVKVQPEDFPDLYDEYSNKYRNVIAVYADSSMNIGIMVIDFADRKEEAIYILYSLWDKEAFGEF